MHALASPFSASYKFMAAFILVGPRPSEYRSIPSLLLLFRALPYISQGFHGSQLLPVTTAQNRSRPINTCVSTVAATRVRRAIERFHTVGGALFLKRGSVSTAFIFDGMETFFDAYCSFIPRLSSMHACTCRWNLPCP